MWVLEDDIHYEGDLAAFYNVHLGSPGDLMAGYKRRAFEVRLFGSSRHSCSQLPEAGRGLAESARVSVQGSAAPGPPSLDRGVARKMDD